MFHLFPRTLIAPQHFAEGGDVGGTLGRTNPGYGAPWRTYSPPVRTNMPPAPLGAQSAQQDPNAAQTNIGEAQTYSSPGGILPQSNINFGGGQYAPLANASAGNVSALQSMLMAQAHGAGPNLAEQQLRDATDQNVKTAMALGQSQPGQSNLSATRNIAEGAAAAGQQAAGQAAQLRAQQQLAAEQQLGQLGLGGLGTAGGLMTDAQKLALQESQGNQAVAMQGVNTGARVAGGALSAAGGALAQGIGGGNQSGGTPATTNPDGSYTGTTADGSTVTVGDPTSLGGGYAHGGMILGHMLARHYATGGEVDPNQVGSLASYDYVPPSQVGGGTGTVGLPGLGLGAGGNDSTSAGGALMGSIPLIGAGTAAMSKLQGPAMKASGGFNKWWGNVVGKDSVFYKAGGEVPGHAQVSGDSGKNDTVPAMLSPGEGVVPRSAMEDEDKASTFIRMVVRQHQKK